MTATSIDSRRVVVIHGPAGDELTGLLARSGLHPVVNTGDTTIWAPTPPLLPTGDRQVGWAGDTALLLDVVTAARRLGISRSSIYRLIDIGQLEVVHVGRSARIPPDALDTLVDRLRYRSGRRHRARRHRWLLRRHRGPVGCRASPRRSVRLASRSPELPHRSRGMARRDVAERRIMEIRRGGRLRARLSPIGHVGRRRRWGR